MVKQRPKCCRRTKMGPERTGIQDQMQNYTPPPPPPDNDEAWELQFCKWWGWNWVKRENMEISKYQTNMNKSPNDCGVGLRRRSYGSTVHPYPRTEMKKRNEKNCFRDFCNCLFSKNKPRCSDSLQKLYSTPSNSICCPETYYSGTKDRVIESFSCLEVNRNVSKNVDRDYSKTHKSKERPCKCRLKSQEKEVEYKSKQKCAECSCYMPSKEESTSTTTQEEQNLCCCRPKASSSCKCKCGKKANQPSQTKQPKLVCAQAQTASSGKDKSEAKKCSKSPCVLVCCHCCCHCKCCNRKKSSKQESGTSSEDSPVTKDSETSNDNPDISTCACPIYMCPCCEKSKDQNGNNESGSKRQAKDLPENKNINIVPCSKRDTEQHNENLSAFHCGEPNPNSVLKSQNRLHKYIHCENDAQVFGNNNLAPKISPSLEILPCKDCPTYQTINYKDRHVDFTPPSNHNEECKRLEENLPNSDYQQSKHKVHYKDGNEDANVESLNKWSHFAPRKPATLPRSKNPANLLLGDLEYSFKNSTPPWDPVCYPNHRYDVKSTQCKRAATCQCSIEAKLPLNNFLKEPQYLDYKNFSKFGVPSKNYPWIQSTTSDILDYYSMRLEEEFYSPLSGKIYDFSTQTPEGLDDDKYCTVPEPIDVGEDLRYLEELEERVKNDLKSKVQLDTIYDSILFNSSQRNLDTESTFISKYSYTNDSDIKPLKSRIVMEDSSSNDENCDYNHRLITNIADDSNSFHIPLSFENRFMKKVEALVKDILAKKGTKTDNSDSDNWDNINENCKHGERQNKRTASPLLTESVKKIKTTDDIWSNESLGIQVSNFNDLFEKMDEITKRSKVNVAKIQSVMKSLPMTYLKHSMGTEGEATKIGLNKSRSSSPHKNNYRSSEILDKLHDAVMDPNVDDEVVQNIFDLVSNRGSTEKEITSGVKEGADQNLNAISENPEYLRKKTFDNSSDNWSACSYNSRKGDIPTVRPRSLPQHLRKKHNEGIDDKKERVKNSKSKKLSRFAISTKKKFQLK